MKLKLHSKSEIRKQFGIAIAEMIVGASALVIIMTICTTMFFRVHRVWGDIKEHRLAVCEISNQLDDLTRLSVDEVNDRLKNIAVSELVNKSLKNSVLSGKISNDDLGTRLQLTISWQKQATQKSVSLSGWLQPDVTTSRKPDPFPDVRETEKAKPGFEDPGSN